MTPTLLLRGLAAIIATPSPRGVVRRPAAGYWLTPAIQRNMSVRARRLMRSGD